MDYKYILGTTILCSTIALIVGCNTDGSDNQSEADKIVTCEFSSKESVDQIMSIFKSATIIPLEQTNESIISSECEVVCCDNDYILIDKHRKRCVRFNKDGEFKNNIGRSGRASDEYIDIASVQSDSNSILIYSTTNSTIYKYSINGDFEGGTVTGIKAQQLLRVAERYYGYFGYDNGQQNERVLVYGENFAKTAQYLPSKAKLILFAEFVNPLTLQDGVIYLRETYNNNIHKISNNGEISTPIGFDFKSYNIPPACFTQTDPFKAAEIMMKSDFASIYRFEKVDDYSLVQVNYQMHRDKIMVYNMVGIEHGEDGYRWITATQAGDNAILFSSARHISDDGIVTALVDRDIVKEFATEHPGFIENIDLLQSVDNNNPVIVRFRID